MLTIRAAAHWVLLLILLCITVDAHSAQTLRIGVYQNKPGVFIDDTNRVRGFYIDMLEYVARQEEWQLVYVRDTWAGLLQQLQQGQIDLIAGIAHTEARDRLYDFTHEPMFVNWGQVYVRDRSIQSLLDLRGRTIAGSDADIYSLSLQSLLRQFDLDARFLFLDTYEQALDAVQAGNADAAILSRSNGKQFESSYTLVRSPIVCCSMEIGFASAEGQHGELLRKIDAHLSRLKSDNGSYYFQALDRWYGETRPEALPAWVPKIIGGLLLGSVLLCAAVVLLRNKVRERTRKLQDAYNSLDERVRSRTEELYQSNQQLRDEINLHKMTQKKLHYLATHDPLTDLPNRRWFSERLGENIKRAKRTRQHVAVLFLDLDAFKPINDTHGHDFGDLVLKETAARLRSCLREVDHLARLGGDEFIIMLPDIQQPSAVFVVAEKILQRFRTPFDIQAIRLKVGISIGVAISPDQGANADLLLRNADLAMYQAKQAGENQYREFTPALEPAGNTAKVTSD